MKFLRFQKADWSLLLNLFKMSLRDRYLGSTLGGMWAILNPLLMLSIYVFVFGFVLKARAPGASTTLDYALWLVAGLGPWLSTSEGITAATGSVISGTAMVKNLKFKTELLTMAQTLSSIIPLVVTILFIFVLKLALGQPLSAAAVLLIPVMFVHYLFLLGVGLVLAAINVFFRDFGFILPNILVIILFGTPIFYPVEQMPRIVGALSAFNPVYIICQSYRALLIGGAPPSLAQLVFMCVISSASFILGLIVFRRFKIYFESFL